MQHDDLSALLSPPRGQTCVVIDNLEKMIGALGTRHSRALPRMEKQEETSIS
jgi:hypothetical protein